MIKYIFTLFLPMWLFASLTYDVNGEKELQLLRSFDIEPSFLYDPGMNEMKNHLTDKKIHYFRSMKEAYIFIPAVKETLSKYHVPQEFIYLAMAESNFQIKAYSNKRAAGLWQFMPKTAKHFHLRMDEYVDERRDIIKSTAAAAKYLSSLHKRFGKWYLAALAYNCGGGRLNRAIKEAGTDELSVLINQDKQYLPPESRNYVRKIIALALMSTDEHTLLNSEYGYLINRANTNSITKVKLASGDSLMRISKLLHIPFEELKKINRQLNYDFVPPYARHGYNIYIPYDKLALFKQKYKKESIKNIYKIHIVKSGENLSVIGKEYGVAYHLIKDFNHLKSNRLKLKQKLVIPIAKNSHKRVIHSSNYYMVRRGDSLESIAKAHKISVHNLRAQNHIRGSLIKVGDRLKLYE